MLSKYLYTYTDYVVYDACQHHGPSRASETFVFFLLGILYLAIQYVHMF